MRFSPIVLLLFATLVLLGIGMSIWQANEANHARKLAIDRLQGETKARLEAHEQRKLADQRFIEAEEQPANAAKPVESQEQAIAAIKKLGGKVTFDKKSPNKPW